jgi:putative membrane protein
MDVGSDDSLNQSMNAAVKHYASLFKLPSYRYVVLFLALICIGGASVSTVSLFRSYEGLAYGALLGVSLFLATLFLDYLSSKLVMRRDPIYDLRRTSTLSLFCWAMWLFFILFGSITGMLYGTSWWVRLCLLGFSSVLIFRLIVINATSFLDAKRIVLASLLWPCLNMTPFIVLWIETGYPITFQIIIFLVFSSALGLIMCYSFLFLINEVVNGTLSVPALSLFKAFLLSWIVDLNAPFEGLLERLSKQQSVELALFRFDSLERKVCMIIPSIHPGPFKNIGSSILPSLLKDALEKRFSCIACVPHGLFGHELDLASQTQNQKVIDNVIDAMDFPASKGAASPFVTASNGLASACCQIFGDVAFLSVTLSPQTTEDLPEELGLFVQDRALQLGLACCAVVNAHNSIAGMKSMPEALNSLKSVSASCLEKAASMPRLQFEIGASTVHPAEFRLRDGLGYGGITVIVSRTANQKAAYVVIDGNNIISGLREKILSALNSIGIDAGEVFTTDTHSVSGIVLGRRGYHPIGEVMDHEKLIDCIKRATHAALADLNRAKAGCRTISVSNVKVIGSEQLESLSLLTDKGLQIAKKAIVPISLISGLVLMLFLLFV